MNKKSPTGAAKKSKAAKKKTAAVKKAPAAKKPAAKKKPASAIQPRVAIPTVPVDVALVNGSVVVKAAEITKNQEVHWTCNAGHLEIIFTPATPFGGTTYRTRKGGGCFSGPPKTTTTKTYSYTVKVHTEDGVKQGAAQLTVK